MVATLRPFRRSTDRLGNVRMDYDPPLWTRENPTEYDLSEAVTMLRQAIGLALFFDEQPITTHGYWHEIYESDYDLRGIE